eukprot:8288648-Pyramimonas_sp.AAC.1
MSGEDARGALFSIGLGVRDSIRRAFDWRTKNRSEAHAHCDGEFVPSDGEFVPSDGEFVPSD